MIQRKQRVLAFARVACSKPGNKNLQEQRQNILDFAERKNILIDAFIEIIGVSGTEILGQKIENLIELLQEGDTLIIADLSRISRSLLDLSRIMEILKNKKINLLLASFDKNDDDQLPFGFNGEEEASIVKFIFKKYLEGWSFGKIVRHLNASE